MPSSQISQHLNIHKEAREEVFLTLIVPVFNEEDNINIFVNEIKKTFSAEKLINFNIIFVNDGSHDGTLDLLVKLHQENNNICVIDLSRNFGKEAALTAGLDMSKGDVVVPIDVDLQHPPEIIFEMIEKWREGFEVVLAKRTNRSSETWFKKTSANWFYKINNWISEITVPEDVGDFRLMDRKVVDAMAMLPESKRFMKGLFAWIGFKTTVVEYEQNERMNGTTKFSGFRLMALAIEGLISFSIAPLRLWTYLGCMIAALSFIYVVVILSQFFIFGIAVPGYASLIVAVTFLGGLQLIGIGMLGEYLGRVFVESKRRPVYLVRDIYER
jgi:polyisoprenyl-phosphate glycosyltransferase